MLPHEHHDDLNDSDHKEAHAEADDLIDYLKLIFHTDLGDGHMESFNQGEGHNLDFNVAIIFIPATAQISYEHLFIKNKKDGFQLPSPYPDDIPFLKEYFLSNINFRGPPVSV